MLDAYLGWDQVTTNSLAGLAVLGVVVRVLGVEGSSGNVMLVLGAKLEAASALGVLLASPETAQAAPWRLNARDIRHKGEGSGACDEESKR